MEELQYPIGRFQYKGPYTESERQQFIKTIASLPSQIKDAVKNLSKQQLETTYRPGGWTVHQLVNHMGDSHMNAFIRCKLALTEENPTIKPYDQDRWVELGDTTNTQIEVSITLLEALHEKWVALLKLLSEEDYNKTLMHPESGPMTLHKILGMYAWHCNHHLAHIHNLKKRMNW